MGKTNFYGSEMKIGVLGGTFDPIHVAHLAVAREARQKLGLDYVVFIPAGQPWMKEGCPVSPANLRLEMVKEAVAKNPFFKVSSLEVESPNPSYTIETILALRRELGEGVELNLILGADALAQMPQWKNPMQILEICNLVVFDRPGHRLTARISQDPETSHRGIVMQTYCSNQRHTHLIAKNTSRNQDPENSIELNSKSEFFAGVIFHCRRILAVK